MATSSMEMETEKEPTPSIFPRPAYYLGFTWLIKSSFDVQKIIIGATILPDFGDSFSLVLPVQSVRVRETAE